MVCITSLFFSVTFCSSLTIDNGWLSTDNVHYSVVVIARCLEGFMFAEGIVAKALECLEFGVWNDTLTSCIRECTSTRCRNDNVLPPKFALLVSSSANLINIVIFVFLVTDGIAVRSY